MHKLSLSRYQRNGFKILLIVVAIALLFSAFMLYNNLNANLNDADLNVLSIMNANAQRLLSIIEHHKDGFYGQSNVLLSMPFFTSATSEEIQSQYRTPSKLDMPCYLGSANPFREDTPMYTLIAQTRSLVLSNSELDTLLFYSPVSRRFAGIAGNGKDVIISSLEEMNRTAMLSCQQWSDLLWRRNLVLTPASTDPRGTSRMLWSTIMENGVFCIYGITADAMDRTIFNVNYGPVYMPHIFLLYDNDGEMIMKSDAGYEELANHDWSAMPSISSCCVGGKKLTVMNLALQGFSGLRFVIGFEKTRTLALNGNSIHYFIIQCAVWLISLLACTLLMARYYSRPIRNILTVLPQDGPLRSASNEVTNIADSIQNLSTRLCNTTLLIEQQSQQLRREYLRKALLSSKLSETEILEITQSEPEGFFDRYGIIIFCRQTENLLTEAAARTILSPDLFPCSTAILMHQNQLILIISDAWLRSEDLCSFALNCHQRLQQQTGAVYQVYASELCSGAAVMNGAYFHAMLNGNLKSMRKLSEAVTNSPRNKHLGNAEGCVVDALEAWDYKAAFGSFKEYVEAVFKLYESPAERAILLSGLMGTVYCHISDANPQRKEEVSNALLQSLIANSASCDEILATWQPVFRLLEDDSDQRTTALFRKINAYMEIHYTDSSLSLTMLAEALNVSTASLSREFKRNTGGGYLEHLHRIRIAAAKKHLRESKATIREISEMVGYDSVLTMTRAFKKYEDATPGSFRAGDVRTNE